MQMCAKCGKPFTKSCHDHAPLPTTNQIPQPPTTGGRITEKIMIQNAGCVGIWL